MIFDALRNNISPVQQTGVRSFVTVQNYIFFNRNFQFVLQQAAGFMNEGFLVVTSSQKIKSHAVESQKASLVWPCLSLTEKQHTVNRMIIFNDSISKFYQSAFEIILSSRRMPRLLPRHIYVFQYLPWPKKMPRQLNSQES